jgi:hypothetical protein
VKQAAIASSARKGRASGNGSTGRTAPRIVHLPYRPRPLQLALHEQMRRFNVLVCHRRFGNTTEVKSADYNTVKALVAGQIDTFLGFRFIRSQRLTLDGSGDRQCFAWRKSGLLLAVGQAPSARISERDDKSYSTQVYYCMSIGATRMEEEAVVEIATTP